MSTAERLLVPGPEQAVALYREHARALRAFVASRVRDPAAAEDILQETFLAALARGVPEGEAARWLFAVARNKALKHARDRRETAPVEAAQTGAAADPAAAMGVDEERTRVQGAVAALEEELEEVIRLRYEGGLDYRAIAERLGVPVSTVQGRLKRAREALRRALAPKEKAP